MKNSENEIREIEQLKTTVMPDNFWQDSNYFRVQNHTTVHASMTVDALSKIAHETIIQHESLILAQDERWRRA